MKSIRSVAIWATVCFGLVGVTSADLVDLSVDVNGTAIAATGQLTYFERYDPDPATGTGVFEPFVRIQGNGIEKGYNTDGAVEFDTKSGMWCHSIKLRDIPVVGGKLEFLLDIDQSNSADGRFLSLDVMKIYLAASGDLTGYWNPDFGTPIYDLGDNWVKMNNEFFKPGSGTGDIRILIPKDLCWDDESYLYLYSELGGNGGCVANDGPEEWGVIPEPATVTLLMIGGLNLLRHKKQ